MEKLIKIRITDTLNNNECTADVKYDETYSDAKIAYDMIETIEKACSYFVNLQDDAWRFGIYYPDQFYNGEDEEGLKMFWENRRKWMKYFSNCLDNLKIETMDGKFDNFPSAKRVAEMLRKTSIDDCLYEKKYSSLEKCENTPITVRVQNEKTKEEVDVLFDFYNKTREDYVILNQLRVLIWEKAYFLIDEDETRVEELNFKVIDDDLDKISDNFPTKEEFMCGSHYDKYRQVVNAPEFRKECIETSHKIRERERSIRCRR